MTDLALATTYPHGTPTDGTARSSEPPRLSLVRVLGRGGCATVYEARHADFGDVAVKIGDLTTDLDSAAVVRTMREADIARRVDHPNVVLVLDSGCTEDGSPFVVMERLVGVDLEVVTMRAGPLDLAVVAAIGLDVLSALEAVHEVDIIHRDLKPTNVMLVVDPITGAPTVKLIDFGVARDVGAGKLTQTGVVVGTPQCLSPEQARGDACDVRVDVWAAGVLLYELLTGRSPFEAPTVHETLASILFGAKVSVRDARDTLPEALAAVIDRSLERDPDARFATAREMRDALVVAIEQAGIEPSYASVRGLLESTAATATTWTDHVPANATPVLPQSGVRRIERAAPRRKAAPGIERRVLGLGVAFATFALVVGFAIGRAAHAGDVRHFFVPMVTPLVALAPTPDAVAEDDDHAKKATDALPSRREEARVYVERARDSYRHGRFESAYRDYLEATRIDRGYASAFRGLHDSADRTGRHDVARSALRRYRSILRNGR